MASQGRNERCACGRGKKFKKCCGRFTLEELTSSLSALVRSNLRKDKLIDCSLKMMLPVLAGIESAGARNSGNIRRPGVRTVFSEVLAKSTAIVHFVHFLLCNRLWLCARQPLLSIYLLSSATQLDHKKLTKLTMRPSFGVFIGKKVRIWALRSSNEPNEPPLEAPPAKEKKNYQSSLVRRFAKS
jgi:hypothetical protein